ncbi:dnaJ-like subfamily C member 27 [Solea senegalensis]|uniref:DnaJ-like subfamily C member 27 n=1 Tax=Solea senegalensis TaxID=28829 RepID=A0AAV6REQ2_SOLSE|nr:dnaJ-like subfamily C member 27 [Solea senegalensis]
METNAPKRRDNKKSLRVKVISLGNAEVGKSCIIKRYCEKRFVPKYLATIGIDYGVTKVQVRDREIKVNIFDMAGHPFFYEVRNEFYKDSQGVLLVYDVGLRESFDALDSWLGEMKQEMGSQANMDSIVFIVCANKVDLTKRRVVDEGEGRLWAESRGFHYFETSAQSGEGINEMFQRVNVTRRHRRRHVRLVLFYRRFLELNPTVSELRLQLRLVWIYTSLNSSKKDDDAFKDKVGNFQRRKFTLEWNDHDDDEDVETCGNLNDVRS